VAPAAAKKDTSISSLLTLGARDQKTLPEDFKIGSLADLLTGDADAQQAMKTAGVCLSKVAASKVDTTMLAPEAQGRISDTISFGIQRGAIPRAWRLGSLRKRETGELSAAVRLFGPAGTAEGEITLEHSGHQWLVSDFQMSLDALLVKPEKQKERFFPSSYRWMLEE